MFQHVLLNSGTSLTNQMLVGVRVTSFLFIGVNSSGLEDEEGEVEVEGCAVCSAMYSSRYSGRMSEIC